jgi:hypothetical protein
MKGLADHMPVANNDGADHGVWFVKSLPSGRQLQRAAHEPLVRFGIGHGELGSHVINPASR